MINLEEIGKYYSVNDKKSVLGVSGINLKFDIGDFVLFLGESGSGKTTILNIMSLMSEYDEGEYHFGEINIEKCSQSERDYLRRRFFGIIPQNLGLIESYTIYENIENELLLCGYSSALCSKLIERALRELKLWENRNEKAMNLSDGERQRVAIARAIAKDPVIIIADEPIGNLDHENVKIIADIFNRLAHNRLIILSTHDESPFQSAATRRIIVEQGSIKDDILVNDRDRLKDSCCHGSSASVKVFGLAKMAIKDLFARRRLIAILFLLFTFFIITAAFFFVSFLDIKSDMEESGGNTFFFNYDKNRIVLKKQDGQPFNNKDYKRLSVMPQLCTVVKNDIFLDTIVGLDNGDLSVDGFVYAGSELESDSEVGSREVNGNKIVVSAPYDTFGFSDEVIERNLNKVFRIDDLTSKSYRVRLIGANYSQSNRVAIYLSDKILEKIRSDYYSDISTIKFSSTDGAFQNTEDDGYELSKSRRVKPGGILLPEDLKWILFNSNTAKKGKMIKLHIKNDLFQEELVLRYLGTYSDKSFKEKTGMESLDKYVDNVFINPADYERLFKKGNYQISVYINKEETPEQFIGNLRETGFDALPLKEYAAKESEAGLYTIQLVVLVLASTGLLLVAFIVPLLILRMGSSRYGIMRFYGMNKTSCFALIMTEFSLVLLIVTACLSGLWIITDGLGEIDYELMTHFSKIDSAGFIAIVSLLFIVILLAIKLFVNKLYDAEVVKLLDPKVRI